MSFCLTNSLFQCLVKGCHKRIRIVHTIEFTNGGSEIQIMRVAVYEEEWVGPTSVVDQRYVLHLCFVLKLRQSKTYFLSVNLKYGVAGKCEVSPLEEEISSIVKMILNAYMT